MVVVKIYNKLVRDKIPEIIKSNGKECKISILSDIEYEKMLEAKLNEELVEYLESKEVEELADLLEVIKSLALLKGYTWEYLDNLRQCKADARGGFNKKILLKEVLERK